MHLVRSTFGAGTEAERFTAWVKAVFRTETGQCVRARGLKMYRALGHATIQTEAPGPPLPSPVDTQ
jgi:hypothetical protein